MRTKTILILLCLLSWATTGYGATFTAKVVNGTEGKALSGYPVKVKVLEKSNNLSQKVISELEGRTDKRGVFAGTISAEQGSFMVAEINYRGIPYLSKPLTTAEKRQHYDLVVEGYEITSSHAEIAIPSRTMVITPKDERTLEVYDTLQVINSGSRTYVGTFNDKLDLSQVLYFPVPQSYRLIGFQAGVASPRIRTLGRGIVSQNEIKPGESQVAMRYLVMSDIGFFDLSLFSEKDAPEVEKIDLYFPASGTWRIKPGDLNSAGLQTSGSTNFQVWQGSPGSVLRLKAYGPTYGGGINYWHAAIVLAVFTAFSSLVLWRRKISHWHLRLEERKLKKLQDLIAAGTEGQKTKEYYQPFRSILDDRILEAKQILTADDHASARAYWHKKRV